MPLATQRGKSHLLRSSCPGRVLSTSDESRPVKGKSVSRIFWPQVEISAQGTLESLQQVIRLTHLWDVVPENECSLQLWGPVAAPTPRKDFWGRMLRTAASNCGQDSLDKRHSREGIKTQMKLWGWNSQLLHMHHPIKYWALKPRRWETFQQRLQPTSWLGNALTLWCVSSDRLILLGRTAGAMFLLMGFTLSQGDPANSPARSSEWKRWAWRQGRLLPGSGPKLRGNLCLEAEILACSKTSLRHSQRSGLMTKPLCWRAFVVPGVFAVKWSLFQKHFNNRTK